MTDLLTTALFWGFCCAVIGVAVVSVFGTDDTPLRWYFRWVFSWNDRRGWRSWIASPIGGCAICTSGQLGLWSSWAITSPFSRLRTDCFLHILAGCSAVLCAFIINRAYKWLERRM
jgi:hypothetical protein